MEQISCRILLRHLFEGWSKTTVAYSEDRWSPFQGLNSETHKYKSEIMTLTVTDGLIFSCFSYNRRHHHYCQDCYYC
jgi:hypothetical protein